MISFNNDWEFVYNWSEEFLTGAVSGENVRLPHTVKLFGLHYSDNRDYETVSGYKKTFYLAEDRRGQRVFIQFDGAGHLLTLYVNGKECGKHFCGYTAYRKDITDFVDFGKENTICVKLDSTENPAIPPFGLRIDYLTYGGLYRPVYLDFSDETYVSDIFVHTPSLDTADVSVAVSGEDFEKVRISIIDAEGEVCAEALSEDGKALIKVEGAKVWDIDSPNLYKCRAAIVKADGSEGDVREVNFGFRTCKFLADGFYLNGKKVFLRGLNRHQCYPYVGYAVSDSLQRDDARILKDELSCVIVRTSHYPQSQAFIDECDKIGLLVFTEIPGWNHIGDEKWKEIACKNTEEMVLQYRNHPSIILWGTRINESEDDDALYEKTNEIAHKLDVSRQTGGVKYQRLASEIEDVYTFNDFIHSGNNEAVTPKQNVVHNLDKPLMITEHNGHMYPTKPFDTWEHRQNQALRHAKVQNGAAADNCHVGCIGWCMFDYATHKNFGSGDRTCYHGVMDFFRNPKTAAYMYESQGDKKPVLEVGSPIHSGDYASAYMGDTYVFTNMDEVDVYRNGEFFLKLERSEFTSLPHPPFVMPNVGGWDDLIADWRFDGIRDGKVIISRKYYQTTSLHIDARVSSSVLYEGDCYDMAAVRIRVLDECGAVAPYGNGAIRLEIEGPAEIVGPDIIATEGGMTGTYIRTTGDAGDVLLHIKPTFADELTLAFKVEK